MNPSLLCQQRDGELASIGVCHVMRLIAGSGSVGSGCQA